MWFDVQQAVASLVGGNCSPANLAPATFATAATKPGARPRSVATVAGVAAAPAENSGGTDDAERLAHHLAARGPTTYGAAAVALGWGATRAWKAEAQLIASGRAAFDHLGRAILFSDGSE